MAVKPISFSIDTTNDDPKYLIHNIKQGDDLQFTIDIYQDSANLNLVGQTVNVIVRRANKNDTEINTGNSLLSINGNTLIATFKDEYMVTDAVGDCKLEVVLTDSSGGSTTNTCIFAVQESLQGNLIVKLDDKIDTLAKINTFIDNFNIAKDVLEADLAAADEKIGIITTKNSEAVININRLEADTVTGTELAIRLESDFPIGNQLDSNLKQDFVIGNSLLALLLTAISNGNIVISQLQNVNWPYIQSMFNLLENMVYGSKLTDGNGNYLTDGNGNYLTM
jgi:hypothetical protein